MNIISRNIDGRQLCCTVDVNDTLNVKMEAVFIVNTLKVAPDLKVRNAYYWLPERVPMIRDALVNYLNKL